MQERTTIKARAIIPIYFSSVTNTSKKLAYMLQQKLEESNFLATVTNIGDVDKDELLQHQGPLVLILSTYGNGGSPADGEDFREWLRNLEKKNYFANIQLSILGLGNRSFQHFCGNSVTIRELLLFNGAKELTELVTCNSASTEETGFVKFPMWSDTLISKLKQKYEIKDIDASQLLQKFKITTQTLQIKETDWEKELQHWEPKLGKQYLTFHRAFKSDVIHIKQLRQQEDGRSTLWLRLKVPQGLSLLPACNISVYPENVRKQGQEPYKGSFSIVALKKNSKVPYPPLPLESLWKISNFTQIADLNMIKYALTMSNEHAEVKNKYAVYLKNPDELDNNPIRCQQLYQDLKPGWDFLVKVGINSVRPYTLASWEPEKGYFDLVASLDPLGLTSKYFKSHPTSIRILPTNSSFYVPIGRPVVMIANGSGIAPFRSLTQYLIKHEEAPKLYLQLFILFSYFGIQNKNLDFYFKQEWEGLEKAGKIKLRIAESRASDKKCYVQNLIKEDKSFFADHLFKDKGVVFICGSAAMAKGVDTQIFEAIKVHQPIPFKAFKLSTELLKNKTVVKEIFD